MQIHIRQIDQFGRVPLPREYRERLGWREGESVVVEPREGGLFLFCYRPEEWDEGVRRARPASKVKIRRKCLTNRCVCPILKKLSVSKDSRCRKA